MIPAFLIPLLLNRYTIGGILALGLLVGAYLKGYSAASQNCHDAQLRAVIASMQRDIAAAEQAREVERSQAAAIEAERQQLEKQVADYEQELKSRPDAKCVLTDSDIRGIGGVPSKRRK